jgi:hypothetical protein
LAESKHINGKVMQTALYQALIQDWQVRYPEHQAQFWQTVQEKFRALDLSDDLITMLNERIADECS